MNNNLRLFPMLFAATSAAVLFLGLKPIGAYDSLYTAKVGHVILDTRGLPKTETFSWTQAGKPWLIHQPIAEVVLGVVDRAFGLTGLALLAAISLWGFFTLLYLFLAKICLLPRIVSLVLSFFTAAATSEFFIPRAQLFAQLFFVLYLYIIFLFLLRNKNRLMWIVPISYLWANNHASFVLGIYLLGMYTLVHKKFLMYTGVALAVSFLPPLGTQAWEVLLRFSRDITFLRAYITEWAPLTSDFVHFSFYMGIVTISGIAGSIALLQHKKYRLLLLILPLLPVMFLAFLSLRHVPFGLTALIITAAILLSPVKFHRRTIALLFIFIIPFSLWLFINKREVARESAWFFPWQTASFLKNHTLSGRMFNEMALGSFLLYTNYPQYQIFFDGRVEMFRDSVMQDFYGLMLQKFQSRDEFRSAWSAFQKRYGFSYALIPIRSYNELEKTTVDRIADVLSEDPLWALIYLDDRMRIFVRRDGKNDNIIKQFTVSQADASSLERMITVADSAVVRTMLGNITLDSGDADAAKKHFEKAAQLNPYYGASLLGLARIQQQEGNTSDAETSLVEALGRSPYLGEAYIKLGEIYAATNRHDKAISILNRGLGTNIDLISRRNILERLEKLK